MKLSTMLLSALLAIAGPLAPPCNAADCTLAAVDKQELLTLAARSDDLWNDRDADALGALFAEDADLAVGDQPIRSTRTDIRAYFVESFAKMPADLRHVMQVNALRELSPGVVVADGEVRIERALPDGSRTVLRRFANTTVLVREGDEWRFAAVRAVPLPEKPATVATR